MSESASPTFANSDLVRSREDLLHACLTRLSAGSEDALAEIYDHTSRLVYGVYSQMWRSASSFRAECRTVIGWLIMVTRSRD